MSFLFFTFIVRELNHPNSKDGNRKELKEAAAAGRRERKKGSVKGIDDILLRFSAQSIQMEFHIL